MMTYTRADKPAQPDDHHLCKVRVHHPGRLLVVVGCVERVRHHDVVLIETDKEVLARRLAKEFVISFCEITTAGEV